MKRRSVRRSSSCSSSKGGVTAACVVEAKKVSAPVLLVRVVVGANLADLPVAEAEPLGAAIEPALTGLRVGPDHRPLDHGFTTSFQRMFDYPLGIEVRDRHPRVLADRLRAYM